jgi:predicted nucleic acid-binding protein
MNAWLVDKSALVRLSQAVDPQEWLERLERGLLHIGAITLLEVGFSARSGPELRSATRIPPLSLMPVEYLTPAIEDRALEVQRVLADRGQHRAPSIPDLLIAATAELCGLIVLHVDKDFELIADITGQPQARLPMMAT